MIGECEPDLWPNGLKWWGMAFAAGYPDLLITSRVPTPPEGLRWIWTGRHLVPWPSELYDFWLKALHEPVGFAALRQEVEAVCDRDEDVDEAMRLLWRSGAFVSWPWGWRDACDTPESIAFQPNMITVPANPLPGVIPDNEWVAGNPIRLDRMSDLWSAAGRGREAGGLFSAVQMLVAAGFGWLVARPKASP